VLNWFGAKSQQNESLGVEFTMQGIAFAHVRRPAAQDPQLLHCEFISCDPSHNASEVLRSRLVKLGLHTLPSHLVIAPTHYQLLLGEAPKVPLDELAEALRWRVKDLIQYPIADAIVDAFLLPEDSARGGSRMSYAVVAQRHHVAHLVAQARAAQLRLKSIDIPELALRNLVQQCCDTKRGIALIKLGQGDGSLHIIRDGNLYLSRQFSLAYNGGLLDELPAEALVLELQRSLDYFERQMRQAAPSHVYLCGENITHNKLTSQIRDSLSVKIDVLNMRSGLQIKETVQEQNIAPCLLSVGAALRQDGVATMGLANAAH
jgi:MSHA biogenesis protein MshI